MDPEYVRLERHTRLSPRVHGGEVLFRWSKVRALLIELQIHRLLNGGMYSQIYIWVEAKFQRRNSRQLTGPEST
jgi:hypothetical protein